MGQQIIQPKKKEEGEQLDKGDGIIDKALSGNGYIKFNNGLIIQWSPAASTTFNTSNNLSNGTFAKKFSSECYLFLARPYEVAVRNLSNYKFEIYDYSASGFTVRYANTNNDNPAYSAVNVSYLAIGVQVGEKNMARYLEYEISTGRIVSELISPTVPEASDEISYLLIDDDLTIDSSNYAVKNGSLVKLYETNEERMERERIKREHSDKIKGRIKSMIDEFVLACLDRNQTAIAELQNEFQTLKKYL